MKLDMNAETPLYMQLKEAIKAAIKDGTYPDNEKIPTEIELSEYYDVSRITVRRAVEELCQENYLVKRQGKGTFVKSRKIQRKMEHLLGFADACKANGCIPSRLVVKRSVIELSDEDAKTMNVPAGAKAVLIERIDLADGIPMIYESNLFPYPKYEFLLEESLDGSLYQLLKDLRVTNGEPLFYLYSEIFDTDHNLVHICRDYIRGEQYRFYMDDYTRP